MLLQKISFISGTERRKLYVLSFLRTVYCKTAVRRLKHCCTMSLHSVCYITISFCPISQCLCYHNVCAQCLLQDSCLWWWSWRCLQCNVYRHQHYIMIDDTRLWWPDSNVDKDKILVWYPEESEGSEGKSIKEVKNANSKHTSYNKQAKRYRSHCEKILEPFKLTPTFA